MAIKLVSDAFISLPDGMNSGVKPALLKETAYAQGINVSSRGGLLHTRPGFTQDCAMPSAVDFQGAHRWSLNSGDRLVSVYGGIVYSMKVDSLAVVNHGPLLTPSVMCYFCQADRYLVIRDGTSKPVILVEDPVTSTASTVDPATVGIPAGYILSFVHGRIHGVPRYVPGTTDNGRPYFLSGNIALPDDPSACYKSATIAESEYLNGGGAHGLPMEMGYINAMSVFRNAATGTGYGPLIVIAQRGICAFDITISRVDWSNQALGQVLFFDSGTESPRSPVQMNDDILYRGADGIRSIKYSASATTGSSGNLSNPTQSSEISVYMDPEPQSALKYVSMAVANNRLFATVGASDALPGSFKGMAVLDTAYVGAFHAAIPPMWTGLWQIEGVPVAQVLSLRRSGVLTPYVITTDGHLWHLDESAILDNGTRIHSRIITREMSFANLSMFKKLKYVSLWVSEIQHDVDIQIYYRPAGYPLWSTFGQPKTVKATTGTLPQRRRGLQFALDTSVDQCDDTNGEILSSAQSFQFSLDIVGHVSIDGFMVAATELPEPPPGVCSETDGVAIAASATAGVILEDYL